MRWTIRALALLALIGATALARMSLIGGDALLGCGGLPQFDCEHVLTSPWAKWLGVPVSLFAAVIYATILICSFLIVPGVTSRVRQAAWMLLTTLALTAACAALWFIGLMVFAVEGLCPYCLVAHLCGLTIAAVTFLQRRSQVPRKTSAAWMTVLKGSASAGGRASSPRAAAQSRWLAEWPIAVAALGGVFVLIAGQLLFPAKGYRLERTADLVPDTNAAEEERPTGSNPTPIEDVPPETDNGGSETREKPRPEDPQTAGPETTQATVGTGRWPSRSPISIRDGKVSLDPKGHPLVGSPSAKHVLVKTFDYTCRHCRKVHLHLEEARRRYGDQIAVVMLPVPMNTGCNKYVQYTHADHRWACEYTELALAVWMVDASKFEEFHDWVFATPRPPILTETTEQATRLIGKEPLQEARDSLALIQRMQDYIEFFRLSGGGSLPKVFIDEYVFKGKTRNAEEFCELLEKILKVEPQDH